MAFSAPLSSKHRPGRPKLTASCLQRQSDELQEEAGVQLPSEDDNDDVRPLRLSASPVPAGPVPELSSLVPKKKRGRPPKVTNEPATSPQEPARKSRRLLK